MFLCYDLLTVPLQVFRFEEHFHTVSMGVRYAAAVFWTLDIVASFFVGFHKRGMVEMAPAKIAKHYIKSWFALDICIVTVDWSFLFLNFGSAEASTSAMRLGKVARGIRAIRLLRLAKFHHIFSDMSTRVRDENMRTALSVVKIVAFIIAVNHFIACIYYGLHLIRMDDGVTWVKQNFDEDDSDHDLSYRYFTSMHWSLTQFTPASMEVVPTNTLERVFTVCVLLFALVTFSSFVSSITTAMSHLRNVNARRLDQDRMLRRYLSEHTISSQLTSRVLHYFQDRQQQNRRQVRTTEADVDLFKVLPDSLKFELRDEAFRPCLISHPIFHQLDCVEPEAVTHICRACITERRLIIRDEIFGHGQQLLHMIWIAEGILGYKYELDGFVRHEKMKKGEWACEVALWARFAEVFGPFSAETNCELTMLDREAFLSVAERHILFAGRLAKYASLYVSQATEVIKRCRWQGVMLNDFDLVTDLAHQAFEVSDGSRTSQHYLHSDSGHLDGHHIAHRFTQVLHDTLGGAAHFLHDTLGGKNSPSPRNSLANVDEDYTYGSGGSVESLRRHSKERHSWHSTRSERVSGTNGKRRPSKDSARGNRIGFFRSTSGGSACSNVSVSPTSTGMSGIRSLESSQNGDNRKSLPERAKTDGELEKCKSLSSMSTDMGAQMSSMSTDEPHGSNTDAGSVWAVPSTQVIPNCPVEATSGEDSRVSDVSNDQGAQGRQIS
jgi:hypothetical protein